MLSIIPKKMDTNFIVFTCEDLQKTYFDKNFPIDNHAKCSNDVLSFPVY